MAAKRKNLIQITVRIEGDKFPAKYMIACLSDDVDLQKRVLRSLVSTAIDCCGLCGLSFAGILTTEEKKQAIADLQRSL